MGSTLHERVRKTIRRHGMIAAGQRVGVAVSGGADSVALFLLMRELAAEWGCVLAVAHVNHRLRGAESDEDEKFVRELAKNAGVEFFIRQVDVAAEAQRNRWNLEDAGRRLRLQFFRELADGGRLDRIAVAHTADDQAETVLAHLLRGTGISGLAGIHPVTGSVIRPLLRVRRAELRAYLSECGQAWREDASNLDTTRLRARLRHALIPQLEEEYQPALTERLCQLAEIAGDEEEYWQALLDELASRQVQAEANGLLIRCERLAGTGARAEETVAVARRLVRRLVREVCPEGGGLAAEHVERVLELAREGRSGQRIELPAGVVVERTLHSQLRFAVRGRETKEATASYEYDVAWPLPQGGSVEVAELGSRFRLKLIDWPAAPSDTSMGVAPLDAGLLAPPLVLRNWRPGDAYRPVGYQRAHKLKELLYRAKVETVDRPGWPVLESAGRVVWSRGFPPAMEFAAGTGTRKCLLILEERI